MDTAPRSPYAIFRHANYRWFFLGHIISIFGFQMQSVVVGYELYQRTGDEWDLGLVGLIQFLPVLCLALVTGHVADHCNRKIVVTLSALVMMLSTLGLAAISYFSADYRYVFACLLVTGTARAFLQPAKSSFVPQIVTADDFPRAVTWNTTGFHLASMIGPAAAGILLARDVTPVGIYLIDALCILFFVFALFWIREERREEIRKTITLSELLGGIRFLRSQQVVLAAISLDMFAVLLGGATTLLPVYAKDILQLEFGGLSLNDREALGYLRTAPAVGAFVMGLILAHLPPIRNAGATLLWSVVLFGLATIAFGMTTSLWFAVVMLFLTGAFDNISVVIRHTLVQRLTPDELRGRVSAVNSLFIGASNELGGFESGAVAHWFGPVASVVSGGIGTILVVALTAWRAPQLRRFGKL